MDIFLTVIASILLIIGFFVICRSSDEDDAEVIAEDESEHGDKRREV